MDRTSRALGGLFGILVVGGLASGCGTFTQSTTAETATHQLLLTTAAERAVGQFEAQSRALFAGKAIAIDAKYVDTAESKYIHSALRNLVSRVGGHVITNSEGSDLAWTVKEGGGASSAETPADLVLEIRDGAVAINQSQFGLGIPSLPIPIPNTSLASILPALNLFARDKQEGWAKLYVWVRDTRTGNYVAQSEPLWGHAYQSYWTILFTGPWGFSHDIFPDSDVLEEGI